jgi:hypothetical protein
MKVVCAGGRVRPVDLESMGVGPVAALCCWAGRPGAPKVRPEALVEKVVTATPPPPLEEPRSRPYGSRHFLKSLVLRPRGPWPTNARSSAPPTNMVTRVSSALTCIRSSDGAGHYWVRGAVETMCESRRRRGRRAAPHGGASEGAARLALDVVPANEIDPVDEVCLAPRCL